MDPFKESFLDLLLRCEALRFGSFTTKSGRQSPYFINTGRICTGRALSELAAGYAALIRQAGLDPAIIFGPAYKGIPLCTAVAAALGTTAAGREVGWLFNRKEAKDHGEGALLIGALPQEGDEVVIVDDVITAGLSIRESVDLLRASGNPRISAVIVSVDRREKGADGTDALAGIRRAYGFPVLPVLTIDEVLSGARARGLLDAKLESDIAAYRAAWGV